MKPIAGVVYLLCSTKWFRRLSLWLETWYVPIQMGFKIREVRSIGRARCLLLGGLAFLGNKLLLEFFNLRQPPLPTPTFLWFV